MQVCLPEFKSGLIWHPVGPRRTVGLPRELRRKQRGESQQRDRILGCHLSASQTHQRLHREEPESNCKGAWAVGGGGRGGEEAASHWPGPAPKPRPLAIPGCACPVAWETGRRRSGCGWEALATPALALCGGAPYHPGMARVKVQVPSPCSRPAGRLWRGGDPKT